MSIRLALLPVLAAGMLAAVPAMAQSPAATPATPAASANKAPMVAPTRRDAMVERRITELHSKLKITAAEQKPFDEFAQAMRDNAQRMDDQINKREGSSPTATAVDQMKAYADLAQAHADEVSHLVGPFSTLYDALSPEQKKMADQSFREFSNRHNPARGPARS